MRAVAYCRVSTSEADQLNSLHNQLQHYTELFSQKEYTPVKVGMLYKKNGEKTLMEGIFADEGITGTKKKNRKAFDYLMKCAENKEFDIVYCKNVQRFARNVHDGSGDLKRLKQLDIKVVFEDGNLNYHEHEAIINMFLSISQEESRMKSVSCKFGIRKAQKQGKWTSNCPYGYDRIDGYLNINEQEAEIIKNIYDLYLNKGYGHKKIVDYLISNNIPTKKGGTWYTQHIQKILTSPLYKGLQTTHKSENMDINITKIKEIPEFDWICHEKDSLKIIDPDVWQRVQDMAEKKQILMKNSNSRPSSTNLFSTIVRCDNCGGILRRKQKRTKVNQKMVYLDGYEWVCQNNDMRGKKVCNYRNAVDEEVLKDFVRNEIGWYRQFGKVNDIMLEKFIKDNFIYDETLLAKINKQISEEKAEFENKIRLNGKGIINDDELELFAKKYREKIIELEREQLRIKNIAGEIEQVKRDYVDFVKYLNNIDLDNITNVDLKKIFYRIVITTRHDMLNEDGTFKEEFEGLEGSYVWINKNKKTVKLLVAEKMFMDMTQNSLLFNKN